MRNAEKTAFFFAKQVAFWFSFVCYLVGMLGTSVEWRGNPKGTGYWRYYGIYAIVFCGVTLLRWFESKKNGFKDALMVIIGAILLLKIYLVTAWPLQLNSKYYHYGLLDWMKSSSVDLSLLLMGTILVIGVLLIFILKREKFYWAIIVFATIMLPSFDNISWNKVEYRTFINESAVIANAYRDEEDVEWYYFGQDDKYLYYQYIFLDKPIYRELNQESECTYVVFANKPALLHDEQMEGSYMIRLDDNEFLCTNDVYIFEEILEMGYTEYSGDVD